MVIEVLNSFPRLLLASGAKEITLEYAAILAVTEWHPVALMKACVRSSTSLRRLILELSERFNTRRATPGPRLEFLGKFIETMNEKLTVEAKLLPHRTGYVSEWLWEVNSSEKLKWIDE